MDQRERAIQLAISFLGKPYIWGGDDPIMGFDCSGLVVEILQSVGILPKGDWTADQLRKHFIGREVSDPYSGCLLFRMSEATEGGPSVAVHVEMCLDTMFCIGVSGGGRKVTSVADAIKYNAFVKFRPIKTRGRLLVFMDPFKGVSP